MFATDDRSHEEIIDMKVLLKTLVDSQTKLANSQTTLADSQTKLADSQIKLAETQANIQHDMMDILRSSRNYESGSTKDRNPLPLPEQGTGIKGSGKEEIVQVPDHGGVGQSSQVEEEDPVETYLDEELWNILEENDWEKLINEYLKKNPKAAEQRFSDDLCTLLHLTIYRRQKMVFVEEIVKLTPPAVLEYKSRLADKGFTALHFAAMYGDIKAAEVMINKNPRLPQIRCAGKGLTPLEVALHHVTSGQKEIVRYLYSVTENVDPSPFQGPKGAELLCTTIDANFYDLAACLVKRFPKLVMEKSLLHDMCALELLVRRPFAFRSGTKLTWWKNYIYSLLRVDEKSTYDYDHQALQQYTGESDEENPPERLVGNKSKKHWTTSSITSKGIHIPYFTRAVHIKELYSKKLVHEQAMTLLKLMLKGVINNTVNNLEELQFFCNNPNIVKVSIKHGIIEFIVECLENFNYLRNFRIPDQNMLEMAVAERNEIIVNFICQHGDKYKNKIDMISQTDNDDNTILHHAAKLATPVHLSLVSGVALQMQRELQWFKGVESILSENDRFKRNKNGDTAQFIFTEKHKDLLKRGEDWMKDTSGSCMIVGALIATVAFAAAFTVPGGNISDTNSATNGVPVFLGQPSFMLFVVADALALFSSITSVLMFLAIYTSRYAEMDFLKSLPQKLIIGLATLFVSMAAILLAFCASLFIVLGGRVGLALIPIGLFGCCPLALFAWLQIPLFYEMIRSTYWGTLFEEHKYIDPALSENNGREEEEESKYTSSARPLISSRNCTAYSKRHFVLSHQI